MLGTSVMCAGPKRVNVGAGDWALNNEKEVMARKVIGPETNRRFTVIPPMEAGHVVIPLFPRSTRTVS